MKVSLQLCSNVGAVLVVVKFLQLRQHFIHEKVLIVRNFLIEYIIQCVDNEVCMTFLSKLELTDDLEIIFVGSFEADAVVDFLQEIKLSDSVCNLHMASSVRAFNLIKIQINMVDVPKIPS